VLELKVAFQGERGAYSESAVYSFFGPTVEVKPHRNLSDVFETVEKGEADYGLVPIENSIEGSVNQTYDLFLEHNLKVRGETVLRIVHCLITSPKTTNLKSVKVVYSHPQALAQCRKFIERLGCNMIPTYDTAGSVKMMKERGLVDAGAIASELAAKIYGMKVLTREIADNSNNYTRFFVLAKTDSPPTGRDKTSIIFSVKHVPGALYHALGDFTVRNINLTKIESRPTKEKPWEYNFYLDFEGHRSKGKCREALKDLEERSFFVKVLGSYPKASESS
jgi:chorismate mutase/prephenate dehydratase